MTTYQVELLQAVAPVAAAASRAAEAELLDELQSATYRREMHRLGDNVIAEQDPAETLARIKLALSSVEYMTNLGAFPIPNITTVDDWGFYPNRWQRKVMNDPAVAGYTDKLWSMWGSQEVALYRLKPFANPLEPTWAEAAERQSAYISVNHRRLGAGVEQFGPYAMAYRDSVVRERTLLIPADSGGWESVCNRSLGLMPKALWQKIGIDLLLDCSAMGGKSYMEPGWHPPPSRPGMELHTVLSNIKGYRHLGFTLARFVWELLSSSAQVEQIETHLEMEAIVLGAVRTRDLKMMVANFQSHFGTKEGDDLADFCRRHRLPLVWGLGFGLSEHEHHWWNNLPPPLGRPTDSVGQDRVIDARTASCANTTQPSARALSVWRKVDKEVRAFHRTRRETDHAQVVRWWAELRGFAEGVVHPLGPGECRGSDLCFGAQGESPRRCACRVDPDVGEPLVV